MGWTPESTGWLADFPSLLPSAVNSSNQRAVNDNTTPSWPSGKSISTGPPLLASFHSAMVFRRLGPEEGRLKEDIPMLVRVRTELPGSSARVVAYRADQRSLIWGPSIRSAITRF